MPGPTGGREFRLYRDSPNTPWGFRLQGGKDLNQRLIVSKVSPCSPADGELHRGDVIQEIQGNDASKLTHAQARELISKSGGSLLIRVLSGGGSYADIPKPTISYPTAPAGGRLVNPPRRPVEIKPFQEFGVDYNKRGRGSQVVAPAPEYTTYYDGGSYGASNFMLTRVQDSLSSSIGGRSFSPSRGSSSYHDYSPSSLSPPVQPTKLPTWAQISSSPARQANTKAPWRNPGPPARAVMDEPPAWLGSLRSTNAPRSSDSHAGATVGGGVAPPAPSSEPAPAPFKPKVQSMHYGADGSQEYRQSDRDNPSGTAKAAHLQYNSPLGLYSRQNVQEAMDTQLHNRPGEGTIGIVGNTEVQKMIKEEERGGRSRRGPEVVQSPSVRHLETQLGVSQANDTAISDF